MCWKATPARSGRWRCWRMGAHAVPSPSRVRGTPRPANPARIAPAPGGRPRALGTPPSAYGLSQAARCPWRAAPALWHPPPLRVGRRAASPCAAASPRRCRALLHAQVLSGHSKEVNALASLSSGRLVSAAADASFRVWRTQVKIPAAARPEQGSVAAGRDGAAPSQDGVCERVLDVGRMGIINVIVPLDGTRVVTGSGDRALRVWDAMEGVCTKARHAPQPLAGRCLRAAAVAAGA